MSDKNEIILNRVLHEEWISVKDKLPPDCIDVLLISDEFKKPIVGYAVYPRQETHVLWFEDENGQNFRGVSFWLPIPKYPNGIVKKKNIPYAIQIGVCDENMNTIR